MLEWDKAYQQCSKYYFQELFCGYIEKQIKTMKISNSVLLICASVSLAFLSSCSECGENQFRMLNERAEKEYLTPIRPASEGRNPCWNEFCRKFTYAPAFDVKPVDGAKTYKFIVRKQDGTGEWSFTSEDPCADLSPIWASIPPSKVDLAVLALDGKDNVKDTAYKRSFLRDFPFEGPYNQNVRPYREAALLAALYIHKMPGVQKFKEDEIPDLDLYSHFTYANKVIGGLISVESKIVEYVPSLKDEALSIAKNAAQFLMDQSRPEGDRLEFFPPTYYGDRVASKKEWNVGKTMTMDACYSGNAFLDLFNATGDSLYYDRALKIADTYMKIQNEDGSFPIKVNFETGEPVNEVKAMLHPVLNFIRRLEREYGITKYSDMSEKSARWMKEVALETFDLTGQFEDVSVEGLKPYQNLTNCTAAPYASYILRGKPSASEIEDARDLIRLSEDQFVHWNALPGKEGVRTMAAPCVYEQHNYQVPVDNSSCNVANAYLDLYEATGDELAFAKAKALIDNLTVVQDIDTGMIPTTFDLRSPKRNKGRSFWINCSNASITILLRMAQLTAEK